MTRHLFKLGSPKLVQRNKTHLLRNLLFWGRLTLTFKVKFNFKLKIDPILVCPTHYSPPIQCRISKFGPQMHFTTVKIPINSGLDWPWTSLSFLIPKLIYLHWGGVHSDCETVLGLFQCCSWTFSTQVHMEKVQLKWKEPLLLHCLIWIKKSHIDCFTVWLFHNTTGRGGRGYFGV